MAIDPRKLANHIAAVLVSKDGDQTGIETNPFRTKNDNQLTAFGELLVGELHPVFQGSFEYTVQNTDLFTNVTVDGGTVTQVSGMASLSTSTTTASSSRLQSKQHAKYKPGLGGLMRFTALFATPVAATEQLIGVADEAGSSESFKNGYMVGYIGTIFGFHRFQNDVLVTVAQASWDDPMDGTGASGMTLDQTKLNVYQIKFKYLGGGALQLWIESDTTGLFVIAHSINYANQNTSPSVHNPNFFHTMWVDNKATVSNIVLRGASYGYYIEGKTKLIELHQPSNSSDLIAANTVTTEVPILTIRNKAAYAGKTNFIDILLKHVTAASEANAANNLASVRMVKNATLGGASYSDINTTNSVVDIDVAANTITGGQGFLPLPLAGKNASDSESLAALELILNPGDTLTIAGKSANAATIEAEILWRELF